MTRKPEEARPACVEGHAACTLVCSQIACGEANRLSLRLYGTKAGLEWHQQDPHTLIFKPAGQPWSSLRVGAGRMSAAAVQSASAGSTWQSV